MKGRDKRVKASGNRTIRRVIEKLGKDKKMLLIIGCGFLGMILLLISVIAELPEKTEAAQESSDIESLCEQTEKRLTEMLENVRDAGKTEVMITFDSLEKYIYVNDSENKSDEGSSSEKKEYVIISDAGNVQKGLISTVYLPSVRGVAVICEGGASAQVREEVTRLVCAALGVSSTKVYVSEKVNRE